MTTINKFFNKYYGIDVSDIEVVIEDMHTGIGYHIAGTTNRVYIASHIQGLKKEMAIVHEIAHVLQELNMSLSIKGYKHVLDIDHIEREDKEDELNRSIEIDARLAECLFVFEECGYAGLDLVIEHVFRCGLTSNLMTAVSHIDIPLYKGALEKGLYRAIYVDKHVAISLA